MTTRAHLKEVGGSLGKGVGVVAQYPRRRRISREVTRTIRTLYAFSFLVLFSYEWRCGPRPGGCWKVVSATRGWTHLGDM